MSAGSVGSTKLSGASRVEFQSKRSFMETSWRASRRRRRIVVVALLRAGVTSPKSQPFRDAGLVTLASSRSRLSSRACCQPRRVAASATRCWRSRRGRGRSRVLTGGASSSRSSSSPASTSSTCPPPSPPGRVCSGRAGPQERPQQRAVGCGHGAADIGDARPACRAGGADPRV